MCQGSGMNKPLLAILLLGGCATASPRPDPQNQFFSSLRGLCGKAFEGRIVSPPVAADADFAGRRLVMHVRDCSADEIRIPFHAGDNRSRTWVISRTPGGLRLKHDHRHEDGSDEKLTQYGGATSGEGSAERQEFPADDFSKEIYTAQNFPDRVSSIWAMELQRGRIFAYQVRRTSRFFRVEFDLTRPVAPPPPPWGAS
jgi:hypothetical protein